MNAVTTDGLRIIRANRQQSRHSNLLIDLLPVDPVTDLRN